MSLEQLRSLRSLWHANSSLQSDINSALDRLGFTAAFVSHAIAHAKSASRKPKQIKDNVWGMMEFDWRSMRLIDTPIMQRLRRIHQLGLSYLTYPTAEHSRFSHSLGVAHVVSQFAEAIDKRATESNSALRYVTISSIPGIKSYYLIHAALLHDIGHLPYSHVCEKVVTSAKDEYFAGERSVTELLFDVNQTLKKTVPLAEVLSLLIILSPRFDEFYRNYVLYGETDTDDAALMLGCLVTGLPPSPGLSALSDLISSASVDADKVDYVNRDALNCGIPVGVDVSRVFLRSGIVSAKAEQIRQLGLKSTSSDEYVLVINSSGMDTIDEILMARTALYQRVYFHAVTRTAEQLFGSSLLSDARISANDSSTKSPLYLWAKDDAEALSSLIGSPDGLASNKARRIQLRNLPKKAYAFGPGGANLTFPIEDLLPEISEPSRNEVRKLANTIVEEHLRDDRLWRGGASEIEGRVADSSNDVVSALSTGGALTNAHIPATEDGGLLVVGAAHKDKRRHVPILCQGEQLIAGRQFTNAPEQQDAFELLKEVGFVMADPEWRLIKFFAARDALSLIDPSETAIDLQIGLEKYKCTFLTRYLPEYHASAIKSGQLATRLSNFERTLRQTPYFHSRPWLAEPIGVDEPSIRQFCERLKTFQGVHGWSVTPRTAAYFISQFPPHLRQEMMTLLASDLTVIDWQTVIAAFAPMLVQIGGKADLVALTPTSGSATLETFKRELPNRDGVVFSTSLSALLEETSERPLVFVDDNSSSGVQATAQFLTLFGVPKDAWPDECKSEDNVLGDLNHKQVAMLKSRTIYLFLCAGRKEAADKLTQTLNELVPEAKVTMHYAAPLEKLSKISSEMETFLRLVGAELVAWSRYRSRYADLSSEQKAECDNNALGYGNVGALLTTLRNVPSGTVTALWQPGIFSGHPWMPLLIRNSRFSDLVIG